MKMRPEILSKLEALEQRESIIKIAGQFTVGNWKNIYSSLIPDSISNNKLE